MAKDLVKAGNRSLVVAGERQAASIQALTFVLNTSLGAVSQTVKYVENTHYNHSWELIASEDALSQCESDISKKKVSDLVILGGKPCRYKRG